MRFGLWTYPWDVMEQDPDAVLSEIADLGVDEVNLATNYHALQGFHPHHDSRTYFFSQARAYFEPGNRFGELEPIRSEVMVGDWTAETVRHARDHGLGVNSWTVGVHNSALGARHPERTMLNCFGDRLRYGLCPAQPAVQRYLVRLVGMLDDDYDFDRIELESFDYFYGTGFGWHHSKYHADLGRLAEFLLGLCFCEACVEASPLDEPAIDTAAEHCRETIVATAEGMIDPDSSTEAWLEEHPDVAAHCEARTETLVELYGRLEAAAGSSELIPYIGLLDVSETWMHGLDLGRIEDAIDGVVVLAYVNEPRDVANQLRLAKDLTDVPLHAGLRAGHPEIDEEATLTRQVHRCHDIGVERTSFYNYGLIPKRNLDWIGSAIDSVR